MRLLVVGAQRVDAGKTTFSAGLLARTGAVGFKPRAGNDYWFDHDDVERAAEEGRLYGKDARKLAAASPGTLDPEAINPVHRLWMPSPGSGTGLLGQDDREFVVDRVGDRFVVNGTVDVPDFLATRLPLADAPTVESVEGFNAVMERLHLPAMKRVAGQIADADRAVVESYGDVARPLQDLAPDAVAVVEPGRMRVYDGDRYAKACEVTSGGPQEGQLEERVDRVTDLVDRVGATTLPPLSSDDRGDPETVARAYERAYDELLAVAEG